MRIRRALLFMPGDSRRKIDKGASSGVDSVIMDLEDGVALGEKDAARASIRTALDEVDFGRTERLVRINGVQSPWFMDDLGAVLPGHPDGIVVPKIESPEALRLIDRRLSQAEVERGWQPNTIALLIMIETARGVVALREIAATAAQCPRLQALIFGAEDLAADLGATRTPAGWEVFPARAAVVLHAKANGLQAIDGVFIALEDEAGLIADTDAARSLGYDGKTCIHPRQVAPVQAVFTPTPAQVERAMRLVLAYTTHQAEGRGAFAYEGQMVDLPIVRAAQTILAHARAAGLLDDDEARPSRQEEGT